jgi:hypothetical protein
MSMAGPILLSRHASKGRSFGLTAKAIVLVLQTKARDLVLQTKAIVLDLLTKTTVEFWSCKQRP